MNEYKYRIELSGFLDVTVKANTRNEAELKVFELYNSLSPNKKADLIHANMQLVEWGDIEK